MPLLRLASDPDEFIATAGTYLLADGFLGFHASGPLFGFAAWGEHDHESVGALLRLLAHQLARAPRHVAISDLSRLEAIDASLYQAIAADIRALGPLLDRIERHVLVRPAGVAGVLVAGFYEVVAPPYPFVVVASHEDAARAAGHADGSALLAEVDQLIAAARADTITRRVRAHLDGSSPPAELDATARALGMSVRSLQRRLHEEGTTFRALRSAAQVARAKLLLVTARKIAAIAAEVGCATPQHFTELFTRATGETPAAWRARQRGVRT